MTLIAPSSSTARRVRAALDDLQARFAAGLDHLSSRHGDGTPMAPAAWLRDNGLHGGGRRLEATGTALLNRASDRKSTRLNSSH